MIFFDSYKKRRLESAESSSTTPLILVKKQLQKFSMKDCQILQYSDSDSSSTSRADSDNESCTSKALSSCSKATSSSKTSSPDSDGRHSTDEGLKRSVMDQTFSDMNWNCSHTCTLGKDCKSNPGFFPFMLQLRDDFWGKRGTAAPTQSDRRSMMMGYLNKARPHGAKDGIDGFIFTHTSIKDGKIALHQICEHAFLAALGFKRMPHQWIDCKQRIVNPYLGKEKRVAAAMKSAHCKAFIADYMDRHCDFSAFAEMEGIKILPFANTAEFFREYQALENREECGECGTSPFASISTFRNVYKNEFKSILRFMRCKGNHTSCEASQNFDSALIFTDSLLVGVYQCCHHFAKWKPCCCFFQKRDCG